MTVHWQPTSRDGHCSDLDLELLFAEPEAHPELASHVNDCEVCAGRLAALEAEEAHFQSLPVPPLPVLEAPKVPEPANRSFWGVAAGGLALLAAAAVAIVALPDASGPEVEDFRAKGATVELEVYVHDGDDVRLAGSDTEVHPGDRLGFQVTPRRDGYLLVVGFDDSGAYPCWPQERAPDAAPVSATGTALDLGAAVRLDDRVGSERIVALLCEEPVGWSEATMSVGHGPASGGCVSDEITLRKTP